MLGQGEHLVGVLAFVGVQFDLGQRLVGEGIGHHKAGVAGGTTQVDQTAFGQHDDVVAVDVVEVHLGLDFHFGAAVRGIQPSHVDFVVEVADVAHHGLVFHHSEVTLRHNVLVAGGGAHDIGAGNGVVHALDLKTVHGRLQCTDGVDFGHNDAGSGAFEGCGGALAYVSVTGNHHYFTGHHEVGSAAYRVYSRFFAAVFVVKLGLGHAVVHVDGGQRKGSFGHAFVQAVHAGGGLLGDAANSSSQVGVAVQHHVGQVAAVVQNHVQGLLALAKVQGLLNAPVKLFFGHALPCIYLNTSCGNGGSGVVLRGENIAGRPGNLGTQFDQRFNQNGRLDGHVQATGNPRSCKGLRNAVLGAQSHQSGHFGLGQLDFFASPVGKGHVFDFKGNVGHGRKVCR